MTRLVCLAVAAAMACTAQVRLPQYSRTVLPNGIVLDVMPRRDVPLVTIRVLLKGGSEAEPEQMPGLASVTAEALRRGTSTRTADQFSEQLDALGATFSAAVDRQSTAIEAEFLAKDLAAGLDLVFDAVLRPVFPEAEIKKMLAQRIDDAKALKDNPAGAINAYYNTFFFGAKHPYGRLPDELSLARIGRQNLVDFHKRMYVGKNMIVVVAGDLDQAATVKQLTAALGAIPPGEAYVWSKSGRVPAAATRVAVIDKPDATQTRFMIGQPGVERTHPDRTALWVVNTYFGGRFTSLLNDELRVNSGLTYGARSAFDQSHLPGAITVSTFTETGTTGKAVDMAVGLLKRLNEKGLTPEQLQSTKNYIKGTFPAEQLETPDQLADIVGDIELYDLNRGEIDDLFSRIDSVTVEKANEIAKKYYTADKLTFVLLGNAEKFLPEVKKYAPDVVRVPITRPGLAVP